MSRRPPPPADGVHALVPPERTAPGARKLRDYYARVPGAPFYRCEFGNGYYFTMERWKDEGMPQDVPLAELFGFDPPGAVELWGLGWCEAAFQPGFETRIIEDRGECEVVQDGAGRHVLFFKGRRSGFMPEYLEHPVRDRRTWEENVKWRMNPASPERQAELDKRITEVLPDVARGFVVTQRCVGGYMYLRSLIGPEKLLYAFYDMPDVVHDCMKTWFELADSITARCQQHLTFDQFFIGEDICYNHGPLISPDMIREFLFPYYQQLLTNLRARQIDRARHLHFQVDTDGFLDPVIELYAELGMDVMSPFEVASGCDVVRSARQYPWLAINGGIDKRILATTPRQIDRHVEAILPPLLERGGYYPTCDHGVPLEVSYANYLHYRKRCLELGG
ncbi:MAG: Uroporphyrinogen decarboxylase (URO-D) [Lentisphaerae bacterium ADurb.BinA184]|nr:MAG: Uroporphyrinogen decarboxylase (URO-D) [Lentisphaerae bacterium ADurb.BinA184]